MRALFIDLMNLCWKGYVGGASWAVLMVCVMCGILAVSWGAVCGVGLAWWLMVGFDGLAWAWLGSYAYGFDDVLCWSIGFGCCWGVGFHIRDVSFEMRIVHFGESLA